MAQKRKRKRENPPQIHLIPHHPPLKSFIIQTILTPKILQPIIHDMGFQEKKKRKNLKNFEIFLKDGPPFPSLTPQCSSCQRGTCQAQRRLEGQAWLEGRRPGRLKKKEGGRGREEKNSKGKTKSFKVFKVQPCTSLNSSFYLQILMAVLHHRRVTPH